MSGSCGEGPGRGAGVPGAAGAVAGVRAFARAWERALNSAGYVPMSPPQRTTVVTALAWQLAVALSAEPGDATRIAGRVGTSLVGHGYGAPEALGRTITLMNTRLAGDLGLAAGAGPRTGALVEAVAAGFTAAVRDRTLDAQDAIRLAAMSATARAEAELRAEEARFRRFATHDALTGLPNRTLFTERLGNRLATAPEASRLAVCCLDLDGFAAVNGSLGHHIGDRLLVAAADRLSHLTATSAHLVARFDSDQFAILLEETTCAEDAIKVADRALSVLAEPFCLARTELPMTASAGIVERPALGADPADLVRAAQIALHWAKADGRACWRLFEPVRSARDTERYRLSAAIPGALRRGEFTLYYQPMVALADGRLVGAEALIRWHHPGRGLLAADQFLGPVEDTGLIVSLGEHLLVQACEQAVRWQELTPDPPYVSVNLAARHLAHPGVVGWVAEALDRTGLAPHRLQLELTERAVIDVTGELPQTLSALSDLGVRIALDDFGVGYCNLANLRALAVQTLKLDRTFAEPLPRADPRRDDDFLAATVRLGRTLGLSVTAEGIENETHASRMRTAGCDTGQGWHFGRPLPADELTRTLDPG